jgi:hypothetical protein
VSSHFPQSPFPFGSLLRVALLSFEIANKIGFSDSDKVRNLQVWERKSSCTDLLVKPTSRNLRALGEFSDGKKGFHLIAPLATFLFDSLDFTLRK